MFSLFTGRRRVGAGLVFRSWLGAHRYACFTCPCGAEAAYPTWRQAVRTANAHRDACGRLGVGPVPRRRAGRWLAAAAFVLALSAVAFAATVASLSGLVAPAPAAPTVSTVRHPQWCEISDVERCPPPGVGYEPDPAGPPSTKGGGR